MKNLFEKICRQYALSRTARINSLRNDAISLQENTFKRILFKSAKCEYAENFGIKSGSSITSLKSNMPVVSYEDIYLDVKRMMKGEKNVLCPGQVKWFSKSSGTTTSKSKFIPVTRQFMRTCYTKTNWDVITILYNHFPDIGIFKNKNLIMGGSLSAYEEYPKTTVGDVSAIMLANMPAFARIFQTPNYEVALMKDWDAKLELMATICAEENVVVFGGVPTWTLVLFKKMMERKGLKNMHEIWPEAKVYLHGGVGFEPYKEEFKRMFPSDDFHYLEGYNASEGYFGIQDDLYEDGMLLLTDNSIYYEFIPVSEIDSDSPTVINLQEVQAGHSYALVITTSSGLWRYNIGDIIKFSSVNPYRFKVVGRTKQYINAFGEELMVHNADAAIAQACDTLKCRVSDYTAAPIYFDKSKTLPGHQWLIEFEVEPNNLSKFAETLDENIKKLNSDYEAKRYNDLALQQLQVTKLAKGSFKSWLKSKARWGAQVKVPRLSNDRKIIEEILNHIEYQV